MQLFGASAGLNLNNFRAICYATCARKLQKLITLFSCTVGIRDRELPYTSYNSESSTKYIETGNEINFKAPITGLFSFSSHQGWKIPPTEQTPKKTVNPQKLGVKPKNIIKSKWHFPVKYESKQKTLPGPGEK